MMWSNRVQQPPTTFVDDVPLKIEADFDLQDDSQVLQEVRNLKMELRDDLGIPFSNDKIHVRIFRDAGTFSDFTSRHFPQLNGRRALFVVERGEYYVYAIWSENVLSDLRHELTHAYLNSSVGTLPLWLDEGLAEYYEVAGVPGRLNREHIPWLSDGNQRGTWQPDLERLASISKPEQMTGTDYAEAAASSDVQMIAFPEMCITGYWHVRNLSRESVQALAEAVPSGKSTATLVSFAERFNLIIGAGLIEEANDGRLYNTYVVAMPDGEVYFHRKLHCFISPHMNSGDRFTVFSSPLGCKLGVLICWDNNLVENARATALM
ncbi:unnamed protein product, partial [Symbiodinium sp. CCMP2456]